MNSARLQVGASSPPHRTPARSHPPKPTPCAPQVTSLFHAPSTARATAHPASEDRYSDPPSPAAPPARDRSRAPASRETKTIPPRSTVAGATARPPPPSAPRRRTPPRRPCPRPNVQDVDTARQDPPAAEISRCSAPRRRRHWPRARQSSVPMRPNRRHAERETSPHSR